MNFLIDTNVISELSRKQPEKSVVDWFEKVSGNNLYISVLTLGEIHKGIESLQDSVKVQKLKAWLDNDLAVWFAGRILSIDEAIAITWAKLLATMKRPVPAIDSLIAATAIYHHLTIVTRNIKDFDFPYLDAINPWGIE